jgi:hypothetical protein
MSYNYFKDKYAIAAMFAILGIGLAFGVYYSWWVPGIAWPAFAALFYFMRNNP